MRLAVLFGAFFALVAVFGFLLFVCQLCFKALLDTLQVGLQTGILIVQFIRSLVGVAFVVLERFHIVLQVFLVGDQARDRCLQVGFGLQAFQLRFGKDFFANLRLDRFRTSLIFLGNDKCDGASDDQADNKRENQFHKASFFAWIYLYRYLRGFCQIYSFNLCLANFFAQGHVGRRT